MEENGRASRHYELIARAQSEEPGEASAATEALVVENMGLVRTAALRFRDRGTEYEDLLQIGTIGMIKAARSFAYHGVFLSFNARNTAGISVFNCFAFSFSDIVFRKFLRQRFACL